MTEAGAGLSPSLRRTLEDAQISLARQPKAFHAGVDVQPLPPHLWERLRLQLQAELRRATGEPMAILHFEFPSANGALPEDRA